MRDVVYTSLLLFPTNLCITTTGENDSWRAKYGPYDSRPFMRAVAAAFLGNSITANDADMGKFTVYASQVGLIAFKVRHILVTHYNMYKPNPITNIDQEKTEGPKRQAGQPEREV